MIILLVVSSDAPSTIETVSNLASIMTGKGHNVTAFFHMKGVRFLKAPQASSRFSAAQANGLRVLACRTSVKDNGINSENELIEGTEMSSLAVLVEMLSLCDRVLFFH